MLRNDIRNIYVVICDINTVMTKPQRTLVSVLCLLAASRYHGHHDRNQMKEQSRMDMYIVLFVMLWYLPLLSLSFDLRLLITPLVSLNYYPLNVMFSVEENKQRFNI
jgi:uncharacterized membrane protein